MSEFMKDAFDGAILAEAVYQDDLTLIVNSTNRSLIIETLKSDPNSLSPAKATYFADNFQVITASFDNASGYDGMLVKDINTGQYWLVNRGTSSISDVIVDLDMAFFTGAATGQIADMEQFYQQLLSEGLLPANSALNIAGHSLGGHLTTVFVKAHGDVVNQAFTYNGAGVDELPSIYSKKNSFIAALRSALDAILPGEVITTLENLIFQGFPTQVGHNQIRNFFTKEGLEVVPSTGSLYGEIYAVGTEAKDGATLGNHGIANLANALFVNYELSRIDPSLDIDTLGKITGEADNTSSSEHDTLVTGLSKIFGLGGLGGTDAYSRLMEIAA